MYEVIIDSKWCYVKCFMSYDELIKLRKKMEGHASIKAEQVRLVSADNFMLEWVPSKAGDSNDQQP